MADFEAHRSLLFGVAYRMLGRVADAEDVVQEAWLRWSAADRSGIATARAYLIRIVTHLAVDRLRRLAARRETYVGPWLPEPLPTDRATAAAEAAPEGAERAAFAETISFALLVVLETLSPLERAVFVLREAFGLPYGEIAGALGRGEAAVRQLAGRARRHVAERRPRYEVDAGQRRRLTERFLAAASEGDLPGLMALLAEDATLVGDGGGVAKAPVRAILGADKVARFTLGIARKPPADAAFRLLECNGAPALFVTSGGAPHSLFLLEGAGGRVHRVYVQANPAKLGHLLTA
ncbi:RNA polymerase sigma-70 factor [Streptomyces hoynatensis]|uniref:RNA polymerase sigma-70 factor n=1 Tax=Streptomyces hoynatensis TaxID=1141874 RepID=A0A3A9ZCN1_9ACTN|nr:RNA polymerase sigma-70 factor [Streptomyces hoynatensis]RKN45077.1 RNA polymerase sigma-70 factor [Streptomyces hoynatensis]